MNGTHSRSSINASCQNLMGLRAWLPSKPHTSAQAEQEVLLDLEPQALPPASVLPAGCTELVDCCPATLSRGTWDTLCNC